MARWAGSPLGKQKPLLDTLCWLILSRKMTTMIKVVMKANRDNSTPLCAFRDLMLKLANIRAAVEPSRNQSQSHCYKTGKQISSALLLGKLENMLLRGAAILGNTCVFICHKSATATESEAQMLRCIS